MKTEIDVRDEGNREIVRRLYKKSPDIKAAIDRFNSLPVVHPNMTPEEEEILRRVEKKRGG